MKKVICLSLALVLLLAAVLACSQPAPTPTPPKPTTPAATTPTATTPTATAATYKWKYDGYFAPNSVGGKRELLYLDRVKELGKGRIEWEYYPSQQLGKDLFTVVSGDVAQFGMQVNALAAGKVPILGTMDLPFLFKKGGLAGHIRVGGAMTARPEIAAAYNKFNMMPVHGTASGTGMLWTRTKQIKVMEDWKGMKFRSAGAQQSETFAALGATAQSMLSSEVYMALSTGVVDGSTWSPASAWDNKIYEVIKYGLIPTGSIAGNSSNTLMNLDAWNKLPQDIKDILSQAAKDVKPQIDKESLEEFGRAVKDMESKGTIIYEPPMEEMLRWRKACQPVYDKFLADNGAAGKSLLDFALKELGDTNP